MRLPRPDSPALEKLVSNDVTRRIYGVLYASRPKPVSIHEIRSRLKLRGGAQQHLDRRLRDLDPYFEIERGRRGNETTYVLRNLRETPLAGEGRINKTDRAWVLRDKRCAQCGRTPTEDGVRLHVDHKIPQAWGGGNERDNLQALCSECNEGKKDYFASLGDDVPKAILEAANHDEPHVRIGEALKAAYPQALRGDLLERIASSKQYQEDWQKRLRELRVLEWKIGWTKRNEQGRAVVSYYLKADPPAWPPGSVRAEIRRREAARRRR